ncbi:MAG: hypothetical protein ACRCZQ_10215 [Bacteroidales bacterium]
MGEKKSICRIPKALSDNKAKMKIDKDLYLLGGNIGLDIIVFASMMQNQDLFGENWFSIEDFCKTMGYTRTHLQKRVSEKTMKTVFGEDSPIHYVLDINGNKIEHRLESVFECVLYKLGYQIIGFIEQTDRSSYNFMNIINQFEIKVNSANLRQGKRMYRIKLNERLKGAFFSNYSLIEASEYQKLPSRIGYREFYLNLCKMIAVVKYKKESGEMPCFTMTVDELASIFDIQIALNKDRKVKVTRILDSINKDLDTAKFLYKYIKGPGEKWAYTVMFEFSNETLDYFDEKFRAVFMKRYYDNLLFEYAKIKYPTLDRRGIWTQKERIAKDQYEKDLFLTWFFGEQDRDFKVQIFRQTSMELSKLSPEDIGSNIEELYSRVKKYL